MKRLIEPVSDQKICGLFGVRVCPQCGAGMKSQYLREFIGTHCRECELLWTMEMKDGCPQISSRRLKRRGKRNYEIVVTNMSYVIKADSAEEARKKLLNKLKDGYEISVEHYLDHVEINEGIC